AQRTERARIEALVNAEPDPAKKEVIKTQNNYSGVLTEIGRLEGLESDRLGAIATTTKNIGDFEQEVSSKSSTIQTNAQNIVGWEDTLRTVVAPEKARLEG